MKPTPPDRALEALSSASLEPARRPLAQAHSLPSAAFTDPAVYRREVERLFAREWLCAGRVDQVPNAGDYRCLDLLDEKLVITRDPQGEVHVLSRICRHRAAEVATGAGNTKLLVCPYHAWSYRLDGRLAGAPMSERVEGLDVAACRLPAIRHEIWEGWIFVNFDAQAPALGPRLAPLSKLLAPYAMAGRVAVETATFESRFNWKVLVDNFMEAYHHIATHRDTLQPLFPAALSHVPDNAGPYSALFMPARAEGSHAGVTAGLVAAVVYPFHLFAPAADTLAWYQLLPERHDRFTLRIYTCFDPEMLADPARSGAVGQLQAFTKLVHTQDVEACESVWSGLHSPSFQSGRLSSLEKAIWQFNQWWVERMAD